jgi:signal transduction histidine kinase
LEATVKRRFSLALGLVIAALNVATIPFLPRDFAIAQVPWMIAVVPMFIAGALLMSRAQSNAIGPLLFLIAVLGSFGNIPGLAARPGGQWFGPIGAALSTFGVSLLPLIVLLFPDGELLSGRWKPVKWMIVGTASLGAAMGFLTGGWGGDSSQVIRPGFLYELTRTITEVGQVMFFTFFAVSILAAVASIFVRYARGSVVIQHQIRWLLVGATTLAVVVLLVLITSGLPGVASGWTAFALGTGMAMIPTAIGVAVLRYRLYDVDIVISRSLVFVLLVGFITVVYAGVVAGVGSFVGGSSLGLSIGATALIAVAFEPVRARVQRWVNRLVYGTRATPYEVLSDLTGRLAVAESEDRLLARMAERLGEGTGADRASVWLTDETGFHLAAASPDATGLPERVRTFGEMPGSAFAVLHEGEVLGALVIAKARGDVLTPTEAGLIEDLAGSAGLVMRRLRLDDELARKAEELEESRRRLLDAEDVERRRLERELHDGPQQQAAGLKAKLGVARALAEQKGITQLASLTGQMVDEAQDAIEQIRSLAQGIYPPLLQSDGLEAAIPATAASSPMDVNVDVRLDGRHPIPVEAAVYFCISEALTNAAKHGEGPLSVSVSDAGGELVFEVADRGPGFDPAVVERGAGLNNMSDRLDVLGGSIAIVSAPGSPTRVIGSVPVGVSVDA